MNNNNAFLPPPPKKINTLKLGFTLSEVLITLVIIGVIAAITIPNILISHENQQYKVAYKKALSDLSRATLESIAFYEFPIREEKYDQATTMEEWRCIKKNLISTKICENNNAFDCWVDADKIWHTQPTRSSYAFIDNSGRAWVLFSMSENLYLVDTNGDKKPNRFGKDRFIFSLADGRGKRICADGDSANPVPCENPVLPAKVIPYPRKDYLTKSEWCHYPPCYYLSWLYK